MARVTNQRLMKKKRDKDISNNVRVAVRFGSKVIMSGVMNLTSAHAFVSTLFDKET